MVEHHDHAPVATFVCDARLATGVALRLGDEAAHHARVKRLAVGDSVRATDGAGLLATGEIVELTRGSLEIAVHTTERIPRPAPIHLRAPVADRERMLWLAEKATELGVASWQAVRFRRSMSVSPRGEGDAFAAKVAARMRAALEQSGGAWLPALLPETSIDALTIGEHQAGIMLDVSGASIGDVVRRANDSEPVVLVGPEGGIEPAERAMLAASNWVPARLAPATLRFETAGIAAIAVLRASSL